ncbi:SMP-30/gluconolactonase/LRE family protein [Paenibacillus thalictri]|uniref:SMP-30/gluconolactonase/LRE family protein n=2 Tax=Paenibacillus thalictri TaxID=2527873 RepID=A0A4Q9DVT2_9BACL|nr:SMP-30/gluconolactonase/LRE family protein [Paenibacillus thalictri]
MFDLVSENAAFDQLASGFGFTEGPAWCARSERLYFTDFTCHRIYTWNRSEGVKLFREPSGRAIGLTMDAEGRLLACESQNRRISRTETDGSVTALASRFNGNRLSSPNDVIVKSDGAVYFTDPYSTAMGDTKEQPFNGVYRWNPQTGEVDVVVAEFERPNGLAFSPDERLLYINDTNKQHIKVYEVLPDGGVSNGRMFAELDTSAGPGAADGMKCDARGNVYVTGPGGIWIYALSGETLGRIEMPEVAANLCFGTPADSPVGTTLFITASTSVYSLQLNVCGAV